MSNHSIDLEALKGFDEDGMLVPAFVWIENELVYCLEQ